MLDNVVTISPHVLYALTIVCLCLCGCQSLTAILFAFQSNEDSTSVFRMFSTANIHIVLVGVHLLL